MNPVDFRKSQGTKPESPEVYQPRSCERNKVRGFIRLTHSTSVLLHKYSYPAVILGNRRCLITQRIPSARSKSMHTLT